MQFSKRSNEQSDMVTVRGTGLGSGLSITAIATGLVVVLIVLQFRQGGDVATWLRLLLACALLGWAGWLFGGFARVVMSRDRLRIVNVIRTVDIPVRNIVDIREDGILSIEAYEADGELTRVRSWGGPATKRAKIPNMREMLVVPTGARPASGGGVISKRYQAAIEESLDTSAAPGTIERRVNIREWAILLVLLAINVAIWFR